MKVVSKTKRSLVAITSSIALILGMSLYAAPANAAGFTIGVSNGWAGNSWRETMVCAIKAEATLSLTERDQGAAIRACKVSIDFFHEIKYHKLSSY